MNRVGLRQTAGLRRVRAIALAALVAIVGACGGGSEREATKSAPTTARAPERASPPAAPPANAGERAAGLPDQELVEGEASGGELPPVRGDRRTAERRDRRVQAAFGAGVMDVAEAQRQHAHGRLVEFDATVDRLLRDDRKGLQHQRFLVWTPATKTLLIAHNTALAPRVPVVAGDRVRVRGLFEWNPKGGVVHWTHHDPSGKTTGGYIRLRDETYH